MTASKAIAERQGLLLTTSTKEFSILTFDFGEGETRTLSGSHNQNRVSGAVCALKILPVSVDPEIDKKSSNSKRTAPSDSFGRVLILSLVFSKSGIIIKTLSLKPNMIYYTFVSPLL